METIQARGAPMARSRRWALALAGVLVVAAAAAGAYLWQGRGADAREYVTVAVDTGTVAPTVIASGTVNPVTTVQVGTYVSGVIQGLFCDFNTLVRAWACSGMLISPKSGR